eukprot:CAMPEP_0201497970 /NCGR_PEP_ID=MMETSP0151_2-20130828/68631_1 /ASSEMBLY_ACC=CAM_ASM_000257 /TAXON_ID=200890 /ORGANISM="Paramoeba atlantica, Strain 621/1 / CCAP 1560/9" /LENGTH=108 /DNA_ID=CAMNT_0047889167 /DNA_START=139 /DNA_END=465 /DNA_ORIENTATION=-
MYSAFYNLVFLHPPQPSDKKNLKVEVVRLKPIKEQALYDDSSETKLKETDQIHQQRKNWSSVLCEFSKHVAEGGVDYLVVLGVGCPTSIHLNEEVMVAVMTMMFVVVP